MVVAAHLAKAQEAELAARGSRPAKMLRMIDIDPDQGDVLIDGLDASRFRFPAESSYVDGIAVAEKGSQWSGRTTPDRILISVDLPASVVAEEADHLIAAAPRNSRPSAR